MIDLLLGCIGGRPAPIIFWNVLLILTAEADIRVIAREGLAQNADQSSRDVF